jgi:hypothetical protein
MQTLPIELPLLPVSDQGRGARWAKPGWAPPPSAAGSPLHEKFYSTWHMPDRPSVSCCNDADCYPTEIKYVEGNIYAKRREDGKYILIPPEQVERNKDNPDGRNHIYAPPPNAFHPSDTVLCFALGGRHMRFVLVGGRPPRRQCFCVMCNQPIGANYLRERDVAHLL